MFPRWLPLYLLGIAALTLFPFEALECPRAGWELRMGNLDFILNLLAFVPLGLALRRSPLWRALALAFGLSLAIELCQQWLPRQQDVTDLIANTLGAAIGRGLARFWTARWPGPLLRPTTQRLALRGAAIAALAVVTFAAASSRVHDFSNWERYPLVIGNSARGDRPFIGELSELAIYDRVLEPAESMSRRATGAAPALWVEGGPILWLHFAGEDAAGRVDGPSGPVRFTPDIGDSTVAGREGVTFRPSGVALAPWVSDHVTSRLREAGVLTLDVRLRSRLERQRSAARIITLGDGHSLRNLVLAQQGSSYLAWIRTPANGRGGLRVVVRTPRGSVTTEEQQLRLVYDGSAGRLWIDGVCADESQIAIDAAPRPVGTLMGLSIFLCTTLCALAAGTISRRRRFRIPLAALGGGAAWTLLLVLHAWAYLPEFGTDAAMLGLLSIAATVPVLLRRP